MALPGFEEFVRTMLTELKSSVTDIKNEQSDIVKQLSSLNDKITKHDIDLSKIEVKVRANEQSIGEFEKAITYTDASVEKIHGINKNLRADLKLESDKRAELSYELEKLKADLKNNSSVKTDPLEDTDKCIIAFGLKSQSDAELLAVCQDLVGTISKDVRVAKCLRFRSRNEKPGLVKIALESKEQKIAILRGKRELLKTAKYKTIRLRSSQTHAERLNELNMRKMLNMIPRGDSFYVSASGRVLEKGAEIKRDVAVVADRAKRQRQRTAEGVYDVGGLD